MVFSFVLRAACARSLCVVVRCPLRITRLRNVHATAFMFVLSSSCCRCFMRFLFSEAEANLKQRYHVFRLDKQRSQDPFALCHTRSLLHCNCLRAQFEVLSASVQFVSCSVFAGVSHWHCACAPQEAGITVVIGYPY